MSLNHWYGYIKDGKKIIDPLLHYGCFVLGFQEMTYWDYVFNNTESQAGDSGKHCEK